MSVVFNQKRPANPSLESDETVELQDQAVYFPEDEYTIIHRKSSLQVAQTDDPYGKTMKVEDSPGVYIIRCRANNAGYTGSSLKVRGRLQLHISQLRSGSCLVALMQRDWNAFGEEQFEFFLCDKPAEQLYYWEELMTRLTGSLEDHGGYTKMLSNRVWSLSSRIKNTEQKLINKRKFSPLPGSCSNTRLAVAYIATFCQGSTPFFKSEPELLNAIMDPTATRLKLREQLAEYSQFKPTASTRMRALLIEDAAEETLMR